LWMNGWEVRQMAEKKFSLAEQIGAAVGSASIAAMGTAPVQPAMSERTIENITSEILRLKTDAGNAIIGIGQRLIEAKELLPHGEWLPWLNDQVEFSERTAQDFMRLAREWSNPQTLADFGKAKALKLLLLPSAEREEFMQTHDVPNMSTRELDEAIRERDEARKAAEASEKKLEELNKAFEESQTALEDEHARTLEMSSKIKELEARPVEVAVQVDEKACQKAADEARREMQVKLDEARDQAALAMAEAKRAKEAAAEKQSRASGDADAAMFGLLLDTVRESCNKMRGLLLKVRGRDKALAEKLTEELDTLIAAEPKAAVSAPQWCTGTPENLGMYFCMCKTDNSLRVYNWDGEDWWEQNGYHTVEDDLLPVKWYPLPEGDK